MDYGPVETRRELNPVSGFADRLSPGESRATASPVRFERTTSWSGTTRAVLLRHGDVKCAGKDSNLRVGCLVYSQVRSPLRHRRLGWSTGHDPATSGFTVQRSAVELQPPWSVRDLNSRRPPCGGGALPD